MAPQVLIADDHPLFREALAGLVAQQLPDATLLTAHDIASLQQAIESAPAPALLLLDLHIPGASGYSALSWFTTQYAATPVVMISANTHPETVRRALDHGAAAFLAKSADVHAMGACLRAVLAGQRGLHPGLTPASDGCALQALDIAEAVGSLTPQQFRVVGMVAEGLLNKQIAWELNVKEATIKAHMTEIFRKLGVQSRTQAVLALASLNVPEPDSLAQPPL